MGRSRTRRVIVALTASFSPSQRHLWVVQTLDGHHERKKRRLMSVNPTQPPDGPAPVSERQSVSNRFGTVTNLAVHYNVKKNVFAGVRMEDLIMRHVVAARLETSRHAIVEALLALIGVIWLFAGMAANSAASILAIIPLAAGVFLLWGAKGLSYCCRRRCPPVGQLALDAL